MRERGEGNVLFCLIIKQFIRYSDKERTRETFDDSWEKDAAGQKTTVQGGLARACGSYQSDG
jgi:hypothetical protein